MLDQIAIISDIHGNMTALNRVLLDIQRRGIDIIYCLGDLAGKGPHPAEAIDCCREVCDVVVRGNWDDFMALEMFANTELTGHEQPEPDVVGYVGQDRPGPFGLEIIRLPYDIEQAIADAAALEMPELEPYAMELRTAVYRGRT